MRSTGDPDIAAKLLKFIDGLRSGSDVESASKSAGLDAETTARFLTSIKEHLQADSHDRMPVRRSSPSKQKDDSGPLRIVAVSDGASRGNPGEASCAAILADAGGEELLRRAKRLGVTTNNVAEYHGVILALELAATLKASELVLRLDSELVVKQLNREYKVKHAALKPLFQRAQEMIQGFDRVEIVHVGREETKFADKLANKALDGKANA